VGDLNCGALNVSEISKCECKSDSGGPAILVVVVVVVILALVVLLSAVWVIIAFGIKRMTNIHNAFSTRMYAQCQEKTGETWVLGRDESDQVVSPGPSMV
jgi:hypothetical protein